MNKHVTSGICEARVGQLLLNSNTDIQPPISDTFIFEISLSHLFTISDDSIFEISRIMLRFMTAHLSFHVGYVS